MARSRRLLAVLGGAAAVLGALTVVAPTLADVVVVPRVPVAVVGGLAGLFALFVGLRRRGSRLDAAEPALVEDVVEHPLPGADHDAHLASTNRLGIDGARSRRESHEELTAVAVETLVTAEGWTEAEAETALESGTWTADPLAAACFTGGPVDVPLRDVLTRYLDDRTHYQRTFDHAVTALQARLDGEDRP